MSKRQVRTLGSIVQIDLNDGYYSYAQILKEGLAFFEFRSKGELKDMNLLVEKPVLFIISVFRDVISKGKWLKVGKLPLKEGLKTLPFQFIQDSIDPKNFELYNPNTGEITPSTREEVKGLECAAVWEAEHVEDRLRDYYNGKPNVWVEQLAIK